MHYPRLLKPSVEAACEDTPVVLINGARQTGKTTLAKEIYASHGNGNYFTLDDPTTLVAAKSDPMGFIQNLPERVILDEVQQCPELFPAIKLGVDNNRIPGRFLLTGSANILLLPKLSESLAGRMETITLWPLSQCELACGLSVGIVDELFEGELASRTYPSMTRESLIQRIVVGGFPEPVQREQATRRQRWFASYITTILQKDIRDLANIDGLSSLPTLLGLLASRSSNILNVSEVSNALSMPYATISRYITLLEATFLVERIPAWSGNLGARFVKTPKVLVTDTGLACHLLGLDAERLGRDGVVLGMLVESMVTMELKKQSAWSRIAPSIFHWRTQARQEVDIVLESSNGDIVGVEVKTAAVVNIADFRGLRAMQEAVGAKFIRGILFYSGETLVPFGENLYAVPISSLWAGL
jgi:predicted AAA+ superfamily ATPase